MSRNYPKNVINTGRFKKGTKHWVGRHHTEASKKKIGLASNGRKNNALGKKFPERSGEKHWRWKGGYENRLMNNRKRRARLLGAEGGHTLSDWENLKAQYNWTCPHCQKSEPEIRLTEDHIIPLFKGGSNNIENIQPLCKPCNSRKGIKCEEKL